MSIVVASCSLAKLFSNQAIQARDGSWIEGVLSIPEYQRPYRWGEEQIKRLLKDYQQSQKQGSTVSPYYLGSIILHQQLIGSDVRLNIIDGQQRITTLALLAFLEGQFQDTGLRYDSLESQKQIRHNLNWLKAQHNDFSKLIDLDNISITLVVTLSEDDAYRFFETQNTGGVRLGGSDIIKAHHLRATPKAQQNGFAKLWESMGKLDTVIDALVKGRYWQKLNFREQPSHRQPQQVRTAIVSELAECTGSKNEDVAYGRFTTTRFLNGGHITQQVQNGYDIRQPLNAGINTIHYLQYFEFLRQRYLDKNSQPESGFRHFYQGLICELEGCDYLKKLYDTCLLLYISQFGDDYLDVVAIKLFRVAYSPRVTNQKAVRETSIPAFIRETPVLDWIGMSYTPEQCCERLDNFVLDVNRSNLSVTDKGVKKRFVLKVVKHIGLTVNEQELAEKFGMEFTSKVTGYKLKKKGSHE